MNSKYFIYLNFYYNYQMITIKKPTGKGETLQQWEVMKDTDMAIYEKCGAIEISDDITVSKPLKFTQTIEISSDKEDSPPPRRR